MHSTRSAARYLAWMNQVKKVSLQSKPERAGFNNWFLSAAAYNAGPSRVVERLNSFGAKSVLGRCAALGNREVCAPLDCPVVDQQVS